MISLLAGLLFGLIVGLATSYVLTPLSLELALLVPSMVAAVVGVLFFFVAMPLEARSFVQAQMSRKIPVIVLHKDGRVSVELKAMRRDAEGAGIVERGGVISILADAGGNPHEGRMCFWSGVRKPCFVEVVSKCAVVSLADFVGNVKSSVTLSRLLALRRLIEARVREQVKAEFFKYTTFIVVVAIVMLVVVVVLRGMHLL